MEEVTVKLSVEEAKQVKPVKKVKKRGNWTGRYDFILSLIGYSIGLGNIWRFPYLVYANGGGVFLIPFTIMMALCGLPLLFLELALGQYAQLGPVVIYDYFCPLLKGLGISMVLVSATVSLYYTVIIAWTLYYIFASITTTLPWVSCQEPWKTYQCYSEADEHSCSRKSGLYVNSTCILNSTLASLFNHTSHGPRKTPAEEFFNNQVLGVTSGIHETGGIQWPLAISLFIAWAVLCLCLCKGVKSSGKVAYFTALFPYVVLITLFIRGVMLEGADKGILFYIKPDWSKLLEAKIWGDAAVQVFFALSPCWGGLITLASYNKFDNNCYKDSIIVVLSSIFTSIFAGFVIFAVIGHLAFTMDTDVDKVVREGTGLAFMVYPEVVTRLPISPLWSILFFVMLLTLGLGTQFAVLETVQSAVLDAFPHLRSKRIIVLSIVCLLSFFGGLIFTTGAGLYWLDLFDQFAANFSVLLIALVEVIYFAWFYDTKRFLKDVETMIGTRSENWRKFWSFVWRYATPSSLVFILVFNWIEYKPARSGDYYYPIWANVFGLCLAFFPITVFAISVIHVYFTSDATGTVKERLIQLCQPKYTLHRRPSHLNQLVTAEITVYKM